MKILFIVPYVPGPIYVRPYQLIRALGKLGHKLTVLTIAANDADRRVAEDLRGWCEVVHDFSLPAWRSMVNCALALPKQEPLQAAYCWQPELVRKAAQLILTAEAANRFDVIHVEHLRGAKFGLALKTVLAAQAGDKPSLPPMLWDSVDCITHLFRQTAENAEKRTSRMMARFELPRTANYEGWLSRQFARVLVTSQVDKDAFLALNHNAEIAPNISVVPNGVDLEHFSVGGCGNREPDTLILTGKMSYHANHAMTLWMMREIMPLIWAQKPEVRVWIVGKGPSREIQALAENPLVTVTGMVPDVSAYLKRASVAVAPLRYGTGIQNKVLEAMACGTPVVANSHALKSLGAVPGRDLALADTVEEFSREVLYLLDNKSVCRNLGEAGRRYVEENHDWARIALRLVSIYDQLQSAPLDLRSPQRETYYESL